MKTPNASGHGADATLSLDVCEKAMEWWLEIHSSEVDAKTVTAFNHWRNEHRLHEVAWQRAEALAGQLQAFRHTGDSRLAKRALLSPGGTHISRRRAIKTLGLLLAAGATAWSARDSALVQHLSADYSTGVGEQRKVALTSQLNLKLNTRSAVNARLLDHHWQLELLRGEVLIDTALTPPLLLRTAQIQAQSGAAQFSARQFDNGTTLLAVYRGSLQISSLQGRETAVLAQGQQARFGPYALIEQGPLEQPTAAWSQGMIVANGQPLQAFLEELARYRHGHLSCDPALANLRVWGTFPLADSERIIDAVADTLKLDVQRFTRLWVNLRRVSRAF
jgi:transmembrane sensor